MIDVGQELIRLGWRQGTVAKASSLPLPSVDRGPRDEWAVRHPVVAADDWIVVVSQSCDIERDQAKEPYVDVMQAAWTTDEPLLRVVAKGNSLRHFLLRRKEDGTCLIADAPRRVLLEKSALLALEPEFTLEGDDAARFRFWLLRRYGRAALEDDLVRGVQQPLATVVEKSSADPDLQLVLDGLREVRIIRQAQGAVELLLIPETGAELSMRNAAKLAGRIIDAIEQKGIISPVTWDVVNLTNLTAEDYLASIHLPLDHYTLAGEESQPAALPGKQKLAEAEDI